MAGECCVFKILQGNWDEEHLMRFRSKTYVFK